MEQPLVQTNSGFGPAVVHTNPQVERKLCYQKDSVSSQSMIQNYSNFKRTGAPKKMMQWNGGVWVEFSDEVVSKAKTAFLEKRPMIEIEVDGNGYIFDFFRMLQIDLSSGFQRSIAWIDVNGDCFFPKFFVDESVLDDDDDVNDNDDDVNEDYDYCDDDSDEDWEEDYTETENPKVEIEIKIDTENKDNNNSGDDEKNVSTDNKNDDDEKSSNDGCGGKRKREEVREMKVESEEEDTADSSCNNNGNDGENGGKENAKRKRLVGGDGGGVGEVTSLWPNARLLREGERSFSVVRDLFMNGMKTIDPGVQITSIHQLARMGPMEKARWEAFHKQMEMTQAVRGRSNTVFAWHGASRKGVQDILSHGFGWPSSRLVGPRAHGIGVYLSPARLPHVSTVFSKPDDNGEKHLILCRVILGNVEKVEAGSRQFYPSSLNLDSGADDLVNPKWYVVWSTNMNTHILPECVVSYKCSGSLPGQVKDTEFLDWVPDGSRAVVMQLFSRLQSSLPDTKVEELKALCLTFKAGKMAKNVFIQQLKSVAGTEVLRSAISGLQCPN